MKGFKHRSGVDRLIIFAITVCYILEICGKICGEELTSDDLKAASGSVDSDVDKRGSPGPGGMWFGPRLGKRSQGQNPNVDYAALQQLIQSLIPSIQSEEYIPTGSKRRFTPRLGRDSSEQEIMGPSKNVDFIPRLGREQSPPLLKDFLTSELDWLSLYGRAAGDNRRPTFSDSKIPPFAPRLGRQQLWPYKEFYGLYGNPRYARSADADKAQDTKSTKL